MELDNDDDDDSSFLSVMKKRPPLPLDKSSTTHNTSAVELNKKEKGTSIVFSIQSSDDDDDNYDDDIATLRASQPFVMNGDATLNDAEDDTTLEKLHATQEVPQSTPWSPLTASPFTPHNGAVMMHHMSSSKKRSQRISNGNIKIVTSEDDTPSLQPALLPSRGDDSITSNGRRGLNLSKVRQKSNSKQGNAMMDMSVVIPAISGGSAAGEERTSNPAPSTGKHNPRNTSSNSMVMTNKSVLEIAVITSSESPKDHTTDVSTTKKKSPASLEGVSLDVNNLLARPHDGAKTSACIRKGSNEKANKKVSTTNDQQDKKKTKKKDTSNIDTKIKKQSMMETTIVDPTIHNNPTKKLKTTESHKPSKENIPVSIPDVPTNKLSHPMNDVQKSTTVVAIHKSDTKKQNDKSVATTVDDAKSITSNNNCKTKKPKKLTFQEQVLVHMLNAFKPFTLKSLSDEMKTSETSVNFVLLSLIDKGLVIQKDFTSSKGRVKTLVWANHNTKAKDVNVIGTTDTLASLEDREMTQRQMVNLRNEIAMIRNRHQQVLQTPSNDNLIVLINQQTVELQELYQRRDEVQQRIQSGSTIPPVTASHRKGFSVIPTKTPAQLAKERCPVRFKKRINHLRDEWRIRKMKCMDFVEQLADGLEKQPKDIINLCSIDTDEMMRVVIPAKYPIP